MKHKRLVLSLIVLLLVSGLFAIILYKKPAAGKYIYLDGTVTAYDVTPSYTDGSVSFKINSHSVDIGGGLRPENIVGYVYHPINVGDKVRAKLISPQPGYLTVYGCSECYVRKSN